jgi:hypothetical protein
MTQSLHKQVTQKRGTRIVTTRSTAAAVGEIAQPKDVHHEPVNQPDQIGGPTSGTRVPTPGSKRRPYQSRAITHKRGSEKLNKAGMEGPVEQCLAALLDFNSFM